MENSLQPLKIESLIYEIRGQKVMLDFNLAELYQVETRTLNQAVKRNIERFPEDFMFQLSELEWSLMSSQIVTTSIRKRPKSALPFAFTEHGVIMIASLLRSQTAIHTSIIITRAFVAMRKYIMASTSFSAELEAIKAKLELLERSDEDNLEAINDLSEDMRQEIDTIYQAIAALSVKEPSGNTPRPKIGFKTQNNDRNTSH